VETATYSEEKPFTRRRSRGWLVPLVVGTGLGAAVTFGAGRFVGSRPAAQAPKPAAQTAANTAPAMTVTVAMAESTRVARTLDTSGTVTARELIPVLPQRNGLQIRQILVNQGNIVRAGQVMAILDDSELQAQINQAQADLAARKADLESRRADLESRRAAVGSNEATEASNQATVAAREADVQQKQADLAQARVRLEDAQRTLRRNQQLKAAGAISQQVVDTSATAVATATQEVSVAQANVRSAQANVRSAQANVKNAQGGRSGAEANTRSAEQAVESAQAAVRSNAARVQQLKTQLDQTSVRAPVSGVVAEVRARVGDVTGVAPQGQTGNPNFGGQQAPFTIIRDGALQLEAAVPEVNLSQIKPGASARITSNTDSRLKIEGQVREIDPTINQQTREATVKIDLPPSSLLKPGMFARAAITTSTTLGVAIPNEAVQYKPDRTAVVFMLLGEDTVKEQRVELGEILNGGKVEIKQGLKTGDSVVVKGAGFLKDGDKVKVVTSPES
jgi:RND family efflux transporter MFP subunit